MAWDDAGMRANLNWQWRNAPDDMLLALLRLASRSEGEAFGNVRGGQQHNIPVFNAYKQCHDAGPEHFWYLVVSASEQVINLPGCQTNIDWQWGQNRDSIRNAQNAYTDGRQYGRAIAMYYLMEGQRHNPPVMEGYRAAMRDNEAALWAIVNGKV